MDTKRRSEDVFDWLARPFAARLDVVFANLFIHHFSAEPLARLLAGIEQRSRVFFCCEPRRSALPLLGSHLIGLLGAGPVTRKDAVSSVHAGFRGHELSDLWPNKSAWVVRLRQSVRPCFLAFAKAVTNETRYDAIVSAEVPRVRRRLRC